MIVSDKFMVNSDAGRMAAARYATEDFAWQIKLDKRDALRLDLLVEETLGMVKNMLEDFYGQLWFTADGKACEIHFEATSDMDVEKRQELLSVMAKLGEVISGALHGFGRTMDAYGQETVKYGIVHSPSPMMGNADMMTVWTLQTYRDGLDQACDDEAEAALDELEKSIVAKLADDILVGVKGDRINLVIKKQF